jgi:hypothetical protein
MAPDPRDQKWYSLAEQASTEADPKKLGSLISQLCDALDERMKPLESHHSPVRASRSEL